MKKTQQGHWLGCIISISRWWCPLFASAECRIFLVKKINQNCNPRYLDLKIQVKKSEAKTIEIILLMDLNLAQGWQC